MDLFLDTKSLEFEKLGYDAKMNEDPNLWPQEILDELYRQVPYSSNYSPRVILRQVDADRKYALGQIELLNQLAINPRDDKTPPELRGQQKVVVPVIIKDGKLSPLDIMLSDGSVEPLTEERLRKAMFRPSLFDAIRKHPGDLSLIEQLYPPNRHHGGPFVPESSKTSSVKPEFLLDAILPLIKKSHINKLAERLESDVALKSAILSNPTIRPFLEKISSVESMEKMSSRDYLEQAIHSIKPTVIQIQKSAEGFLFKTANPNALIPDSNDIDRPTAVGLVGGDIIKKVESDGTVTMNTSPAIKTTLEDIVVKTVSEFGIYKVRTVGDNKELVGWVFPKVIDLNGTVLPLAVFSNGSQSCVQENIAGVPIDRNTNIIDAPPKGNGCFYYSSGSGATALIPVEVRGEIVVEGVTSYQCVTIMGEQCTISMVPGLKMIEKISDSPSLRYGVPECLGFIPLPNQIDLESSPDGFLKVSSASDYNTKVSIRIDGNNYSFDGVPIDKLAGIMDTKFINRDGAIFLGAILGHDPEKLASVLDQTRKSGKHELEIDTAPISTVKEKYAASKKLAAKLISKLDVFRGDLLKEAAPIEDPMAVDKILSIGFLNPENVMIFASYAPEIEDSVRKLSELLLASRLGLSSVSEGALQKSVIHLDKIISELKALTSTN